MLNFRSAKGGAMRRTLLVLVIGLLAGLPAAWAQRSQAAKETKADVLKEKLDKGEKVLVIDVREDDEVKSGSMPGAIHVPMGTLEQRMKDIPKDVELVFT